MLSGLGSSRASGSPVASSWSSGASFNFSSWEDPVSRQIRSSSSKKTLVVTSPRRKLMAGSRSRPQVCTAAAAAASERPPMARHRQPHLRRRCGCLHSLHRWTFFPRAGRCYVSWPEVNTTYWPWYRTIRTSIYLSRPDYV
jgi:hypothetical protein